MDHENKYKIVDFETYCKKCEYEDCLESDDPCFECLDEPVNVYSQKPVNFKERKR